MNGAAPALAPPGDPGLVRRLRRMRWLATTLLLAMAAIFIVTSWLLPPGFAAGAVRAFAEAALIGGLADWFAVTALFRRPLGLPIPHTAIVPARKNDIGRALARFIRDHFLVREAVERRLAHTDLAARLGAWLEEDHNAARVSHDVTAALDWALRAGDGGELRAALGGTLRGAFHEVPVSRAIATLLEVLTAGSRAQTLIDQLVQFGRAELEKHRVLIRVRIHEQSPWWLPKFVDQEIYDKLMGEIEQLLEAIAKDPQHPARIELVDRIRTLQEALAADPAFAAKSRALQQELVEHPAVHAYAHELWQRLGSDLHTALTDADSPLRNGMEREIRSLGAVLRTNSAVGARLNGWLSQLLLYVVENYRDPLSEIVSKTIESWDPHETARRIELHIGTDLQFIRVNGTLVGGLVGLALYLGSRAFA